jgi:squalene-hopene/tetraprenyl-beta-curcumene cyclase
MWTIQRDDGGFDWIRANTAPSELDDHYGVTLALIGVGAAPDGYASAPQAQQGIKKIRDYLADNPPQYPHQSAMLLWAASYIDSLLTPEDQQRRVDELWALQQKDGGWSLLSLGNWPFRGKGGESVARLSDGYGTGLVTYVLRRSGVPVDDVRITRAIHWLKSNQRANGSWLTRSQSDPGGHHSISRAGSAYAIMALAICDELQNVE